ncbi:MFS transporter [Streptomyces alkaliphilus]|uniref:MFS transporter n=1 Tax=Streptomyces alkaliphilus TaxID=1472722 RepID=A0A7W3TF86_9ACTN|nr:MFS transporter [Streptomyces alkaliphilus]MBB0245430.1 MFS transporter [Streptomyces alkaliphilus]
MPGMVSSPAPATGSEIAPPDARRPALPGVFRLWLTGWLVSLFGGGVLYFALGWAAAGHGGAVAGMMLALINLPRAVLMLVGGVVADRIGAWRILTLCAASSLAVVATLAVAVSLVGTPVALLFAAALVIGVLDAFDLPASGSMPRRLVGPESLPRAMALRQTGVQLVLFASGAAGGALFDVFGPSGPLVVATVGPAVLLAVLLWLRRHPDGRGTPPARSMPSPSSAPSAGRSGLWGDIAAGLRVCRHTPVLLSGLAVTAVAAGFLLPVISLLAPVLARQEGWGPHETGVLIGARAVGIVSVALVVLARGGAARPGTAAGPGPVAAGTGVGVLAVAPNPLVGLLASLVIGAGNGTFGANIAPLMPGTTPEGYLARVQSVVTVVQSLPLVGMNLALGLLAQWASARVALLCCALAVLLTGLLALLVPALREARSPAVSKRGRAL